MLHLRSFGTSLCLPILIVALMLGAPATSHEPPKGALRIGTSGNLTGAGAEKEKAGIDTLHSFVKEETGLESDIRRQGNWRELADKMAKGEMDVGVFQGNEFAWAQQLYPDLKGLALAVNIHRYPVAYVITRRDDPAKDFAGLRGYSLSLPAASNAFLKLFIDRQCQLGGAKTPDFFSKIGTAENVEDALDDVVDGKVQAAVADRAALEAYKRRKPGRFKQVKEVAQSQPFPLAIVAVYGTKLDDTTRQRFAKGLVDASKKDVGQTLLTMYHLSAFEDIPADMNQVLADLRKNYPAPEKAK